MDDRAHAPLGLSQPAANSAPLHSAADYAPFVHHAGSPGFLVLTGGEAFYADMGHVGPTAIRRAWFGLVLPALLLNYFGQGALILSDPAAADNPFYKLARNWALIPMVVLAAFATVIACCTKRWCC